MTATDLGTTGGFIDRDGERFYVIRRVDQMEPFFISVVSSDDHWLFASSTGGLTAGRVSPETPLFPYITDDKIHESTPHTGSVTLLRIGDTVWHPFNREHDWRYTVERNLYKNTLGNKLCFEEINHDLSLTFRYTWLLSDRFGFVRECELLNHGKPRSVEVLDGLQNILPASTPGHTQTNAPNLVDAYKWTELDPDTNLGVFTLYSRITDRAEPAESLKANVVYCLGLEASAHLLCSSQLRAFAAGEPITAEQHTRGVRGAYLVHSTVELASDATERWRIVAELELDQPGVLALHATLSDRDALNEAITRSIAEGSDRLARIMAAADGFQTTAEENVSVHHYANVLFNVLRGGIFDDQYRISRDDLNRTLHHFNREVFERNQPLLQALPETLSFSSLLEQIHEAEDPQLERLVREYLPITFGRRHGDPSRPWNRFSIRLKDDEGRRLLSYEGNWRDIFQNWEALALSFPDLVENMVAKFVNASTLDGYNPYRITKEGIDWEVEDPDDPWSYIGYWGDHQIIYLLKLLELSAHTHPSRLSALLRTPVFAYANVPYRLKTFEAMREDPKSTVLFSDGAAEEIEQRVARLGADGKLVMGPDGQVHLVNLLEKLLVPLLSKLGNLVPGGGIWMNTQRPEWNDANNALVGQGLSMVTLYYMRRYVVFLRQLIANEQGSVELSLEVHQWLDAIANVLRGLRPTLATLDDRGRARCVVELGQHSSAYREKVYANGLSPAVPHELGDIDRMLDDALAAIDDSIERNTDAAGLYHAYNVLEDQGETIEVGHLYAMLEGQVAALSAGAVSPEAAVDVLEALFASPVFSAERNSFMLYPDRFLPSFLEKNRVPDAEASAIPLVRHMVGAGDDRVLARDPEGHFRFHSELVNAGALNEAIDAVADRYPDVESSREALLALYEKVFDHRSFTGRSGTMFGFEGLGSIYWHMVSKLLLAVQENVFAAVDGDTNPETVERLKELYYRVRGGIGFNKTPVEYGAFPTDPYSHTPKHAGARQPGMTGQVKEEILTRLGELGVRIQSGAVRFQPTLLRPQEFLSTSDTLCYLDVNNEWQDLEIPAGGLGFTWCQVPVLYVLGDHTGVRVLREDGSEEARNELGLSPEEASALFSRTGELRQVTINVTSADLYA